jgi:hypothetical protein
MGARQPSNFVGGVLEWAGPYGAETRMIVGFSGGTVTVDGPLTDLAPGDPVNVLLGCQHVVASCVNLHNNIQNYGGTPYIPTKNPIGKNNHT